MRYGPDIATLAAVIGDPARANMLTALMSGGALTASELASEAGVTKQTASAHLNKLTEAGFLAVERQGRHRYFRLADAEVAELLEKLAGFSASRGPQRVRTGPKEPAMRKARVCYDHLAGEMGVGLLDGLVRRGWLSLQDDSARLTDQGGAFFTEFGIDMMAITQKRRPLCRLCLDWSMRRSHLAGGLGAALLTRFYALGWAKRIEGTRIVAFTPAGEAAFIEAFAHHG